MKIVLDKDDVMKIVCKEYKILTIEVVGRSVTPVCDLVYWEGNLEE